MAAVGSDGVKSDAGCRRKTRCCDIQRPTRQIHDPRLRREQPIDKTQPGLGTWRWVQSIG